MSMHTLSSAGGQSRSVPPSPSALERLSVTNDDAEISSCDPEEIATREKIEALQTELSAISLLHAQKTKELDDLIQKHHEIIARRKIIRNANIAVSRLPDELLAMIFESIVIELEGVPIDPNWKELSSLLQNITSVARDWRRIALGTSRLWRNICRQHDSNSYFHFKLCLQRSGTSPIHVWVDHEGLCQVLRHLASTHDMHRVSALHLHNVLPSQTFVDFLVSIPPTQELKEMSLEFSHLDFQTGYRQIVTMLNCFSSLRSLRILKSWFTSDSMPTANDGIVSLLFLEDLQVLEYNTKDVAIFLSVISAPNVKRLFVGTHSAYPGEENWEFDISQHAPSSSVTWECVRELTIGGMIRPDYAARLYRQTPNVEELRLLQSFKSEAENDAIISLLNRHASPPLLPNLRVLSIDRFWVSFDVLGDVVCHCERCRPLEVIRLCKQSMIDLGRSQFDHLLEYSVKLCTWDPTESPEVVWD